MSIVTIDINLDRKCSSCGKGGATQNGRCLSCIAKGIRNGEYDHFFKSGVSGSSPGENQIKG